MYYVDYNMIIFKQFRCSNHWSLPSSLSLDLNFATKLKFVNNKTYSYIIQTKFINCNLYNNKLTNT